MVAFPSSPTLNQPFQDWMWDGSKWTPRPLSNIPKCGFLALATPSPSAGIAFVPFEGDKVKINGRIYTIPPAGVAAYYNACYINGVANSVLASATNYYVYVFDSGAGILALDFSARTPMVSTTAGNVGTIVPNIGSNTPDDTRTCVGLVYPVIRTGVAFDSTQQSNQVRSWFNRHNSINHNIVSASASGWGTQAVCSFGIVGFGGESYMIQSDWLISGPGDQTVNVMIQLNGTQFFSNQIFTPAGTWCPVTVGGTWGLSAGYSILTAAIGPPSYVLGSSQCYLYGMIG